MDIDDIELYGEFEDWFRSTMDRDTVATLRDCGAWAIGDLNNSYMIWALFERFGSDITQLALDQLGVELWEIANDRKIQSVVGLMEILVHMAAESLAHSLAEEFDDEEAEEEEDEDEDEDEEEEACL